MTDQVAELTLRQVLSAIRRRPRWLIGAAVLITLVAFAFAQAQPAKYSATASLLFSDSETAQALAGVSTPSANASATSQQSQQDTNVALLKIGDLASRTAAEVGHRLTRSAVKADIHISASGDTNLVSVSATASSGGLARDIANTYCEIFVAEQQRLNHQVYVSALATVDAQLAKLSAKARAGAQGLALQNRAQSLATLVDIPAGTVRLAARADTPTTPSSPRVARDTLIGALLGLVLGLALVLLIDRLDQRVSDPEELEALYDLPLLGVVPESKTFSSRRSTGIGHLDPNSPEFEAFNLIRAHLRYFKADSELRTLLIASADPADGKSTVSRYLAVAAARTGTRVLLLEADLRRPSLASQLDLDATPGLTEVLSGAASLEQATRAVSVGSPTGAASSERALSVLVAGAPVANPTELLESQAMTDLLSAARGRHELVLVDTAPLLVVSDTFPLLAHADGVIIVARIGSHRRDVAARLRRTLDAGGSPILGVVANAHKVGRSSPYRYGYGYTTLPNATA